MKIFFTEPFKKDYADLPSKIQKAFDKALNFFLFNPHHPSLRTRKLPQTSIRYGRITRDYRFTFEYSNDTVILRRIGAHNILDKERKK